MYRPLFRFVAISLAAIATSVSAESLVERLGFAPDARVLILNADDFGMCHAANQGTAMVLACGGVTSSTIMTPCPWAREAFAFARKHPRASLGVHLTHTSEWREYKWGPVLGWQAVPSLCNRDGYFYSGPHWLYFHADPREMERETRAQIDRALDAGVDVTHIDSHMGTMNYSPGYHAMYIRIAKDYNLPCRIAAGMMRKFGVGYVVDKADALGVLHPDGISLDEPKSVADTERFWKNKLENLPAGKVTELYIHCGRLTPELETIAGSAKRRTADTDFFALPETRAYIRELGIQLISYRELRHLQREGKPMPRQSYGWKP